MGRHDGIPELQESRYAPAVSDVRFGPVFRTGPLIVGDPSAGTFRVGPALLRDDSPFHRRLPGFGLAPPARLHQGQPDQLRKARARIFPVLTLGPVTTRIDDSGNGRLSHTFA
jgi:hypothetical protein